MKSSVRIALPLVVATAWNMIAAGADLAEAVRGIKTGLTLEQSYKPDTRVEFELKPGEAALLTFTQNAPGVNEFLFHNTKEKLSVIYACVGESYYSTSVTPQRPRNKRTIATADAPEWMECDVQCEFRDGAAQVTFSTVTISAERIREIKEDQRKAREAKMDKLRRILTWDDTAATPAFELLIPGPGDPSLQQLRREYELDKIVAGTANDYERLQRMVKWTHDRWKHSGDNTPSKADPLTILEEAKAGKRFRCVEYATVITSCAQALGMPARQLALKREDAATAESGAGHLVAEVWLDGLEKWVFVDGQWDAIPELDGRPLNAVEFQDAIGRKTPGLKIRSASNTREDAYLYWVAPYLYYFDFNLNQQQFETDSDNTEANRRAPKDGKIMLVPKDAKNLTVFQRKNPIGNCTYISSPKAFYPNPRAR